MFGSWSVAADNEQRTRDKGEIVMTKALQEVGYKLYWLTWFVLLVLTLGMILIGSATLPKLLVALLLIPAMLVKASLIRGYFMHLRFEKLTLILSVAVVLGSLRKIFPDAENTCPQQAKGVS